MACLHRKMAYTDRHVVGLIATLAATQQCRDLAVASRLDLALGFRRGAGVSWPARLGSGSARTFIAFALRCRASIAIYVCALRRCVCMAAGDAAGSWRTGRGAAI